MVAVSVTGGPGERVKKRTECRFVPWAKVGIVGGGMGGRISAKKDALLFGRRLTEMGKSGKKWGEVGRGGVKFLEKVRKPLPASSICKIIF